ncbi:MAG: hypothetical protein FWF29_12510 [Treponema sp.]|nr:hypothetical protein [Treponema sp.]
MLKLQYTMKLSSTARTKLNDPERIQRRDQWFASLHSMHSIPCGNFTGSVPRISGVCGNSADGMLLYSNPEQWLVESLENLAEKTDRYDDETRFCPWCIQLDVYSVHFIDRIFGATVFFDHEAKQWYNRYLTTDIGSLEYPDLENSAAWDITVRVVKAFIDQDVALPLFGLPTIASALNIAVNLYGEDILLKMMTEPELAAADLRIINRLLMDIHRYFRGVLPEKQLQPVLPWERAQPPGYGQLCGCTTQLIGEQLYREQIAPLDNDLLGVYPNGGMIHLCGSHSQLIPVFRSMPNLKTVQVNDRAAHDLQRYFTGLRDDQVIYYMPCEGMPVEKAMELTGGKRLVIQDKVRF